jgi:hypothetical protein
VLKRARREVSERGEAAAVEAAARQRPWARVGAGLVVSQVMLIVVWPSGTLVDWLRWLMQRVCDQVNNVPAWLVRLPLDARCTGIYTAPRDVALPDHLVPRARSQAATTSACARADQRYGHHGTRQPQLSLSPVQVQPVSAAQRVAARQWLRRQASVGGAGTTSTQWRTARRTTSDSDAALRPVARRSW